MKNKITLPIYTEGDITPKAVDVIKGILEDKFPDYVIEPKVYDYRAYDEKVLVLGKVTVEGAIFPGHRPVFTYSIAQIMTKANAATVLASAVRQFIAEPEPVPFERIWWALDPKDEFANWDFDAPTAIDIETTGNLGETHTPEEVKLLSIAFYQAGQRPIVVVPQGEHHRGLVDWQLMTVGYYLEKFTKGIYHNGKFEQRVLNRILGIKLNVWADTMLMHHTLNQAAGDHKLKHLARLYLGASDWEAGIGKFLKSGGHYELIPRDNLVDYNGWDVYWTYKLWELFAPQIEADDNAQMAYFFEQQVADFLLKVEQRGIPFDSKYALDLSDELADAAYEHKCELIELTGNHKFNPGSWQQVKKALWELYEVETKSTDEKHINAIRAEAIEGSNLQKFCDSLLSYRKAVKMKGTYADGWAKHERDGRVHPTFLVHGTSTGRLSSTGPNAQNVPREKRIRRLVAV